MGVPALARWVLGPSARIDWAIWNFFSSRIVIGPSTSEITRAVTAAIAVRNVMYRNTLSTAKRSASG